MSVQSSRAEFVAYLLDRRVDSQQRAPTLADPSRLHPRERLRLIVGGLWQLFAGSRRGLLFTLAILGLSTILSVAPAALTKVIIDSLLAKQPTIWMAHWLPHDRLQQLYVLGAGVAGIAVVELALRVASRWYIVQAALRAHLRLKRQLFRQLIDLPFDAVQRLKVGGAVNLLRDDAGSLPEFALSLFYETWRSSLRVAGSLVILMLVDWRLLITMIGLGPLIYWNHRNWSRRIRPLYVDLTLQRQQVDAHVAELFGGLRVVRAFGQGRAEERRFLRRQHLLARMSMYLSRARTTESLWEGAALLGSLAALIYGSGRVIQGLMSLGDMMMFLSYLALLLGPIEQLANCASALQKGAAGLEQMLRLVAAPTSHNTAPVVKVAPSQIRGEIVFRNVNFSYPQSSAVALRDITLTVDAGEIIALVGSSGAGKTTLCNLVAKFYEPSGGQIELDGINLRQLDPEQYRSLLGIVEQDVFLFDGTIAENIAYGDRRTNHEAIVEAARGAQLHEFICSTENGYNTLIGERGQRLSGGQRQRLAIARALLVDPKILILDEATSSLDIVHENAIRQSLETLLCGRTCFVIAHRHTTIQLAHRIIRMDHGRIVGIDTPRKLEIFDYGRSIARQFAPRAAPRAA